MEIGRVRRGNALTQEIKMSGNKKDFSKSFIFLLLNTGPYFNKY